MSKIPDIRSRNFNLREILHRNRDVTDDIITVGIYRMGYMQALRDMLGKPIVITSGNRDLDYNRSIGSSDKSFHRYRIENGRLIGANDFKVMGMSAAQAYEIVSKFSHGETYLHKRFDFVHNSDFNDGEVDEQWVQG